MEFTVDNAVETSFISGRRYRFRLSARNTIGEGEMSNALTVALAEPAGKPDPPTLLRERSTPTSLFIQWTAVTPGAALPIDGYKLYMTKLGTGESSIVYDGSDNNQRLFHNVTELETGQRYAFSVVAKNFNGLGE